VKSLAESLGEPVLVLDPDGNVLASEASRRQVRQALKAFDGKLEGWNLVACEHDGDVAGWLATPAEGLGNEAAMLGKALAHAWAEQDAELSRDRRTHGHMLRSRTYNMRLTQPSAARGPVRGAALDGQE